MTIFYDDMLFFEGFKIAPNSVVICKDNMTFPQRGRKINENTCLSLQ